MHFIIIHFIMYLQWTTYSRYYVPSLVHREEFVFSVNFFLFFCENNNTPVDFCSYLLVAAVIVVFFDVTLYAKWALIVQCLIDVLIFRELYIRKCLRFLALHVILKRLY